MVIIYLSKLLPCIYYTLLGDFVQAKEVIDPHWLLNISLIYGFAVYQSYVDTVETNNLFDWELSKLKKGVSK
jgi:hypothetical protein